MKKVYDYPWTESGIWLLTHFESLIKEYGGAKVLARQIEIEARDFFGGPEVMIHQKRPVGKPIKKPFSKNESAFIMKHWFDMSLEDIGTCLGGRSARVISDQGRRLGFIRKPEVKNFSPGRGNLRVERKEVAA